ncbi:unnamed protein product [Closterium sp. NIES-64]|nr:unnamed protein product [Closterium sp. NIES-64]
MHEREAERLLKAERRAASSARQVAPPASPAQRGTQTPPFSGSVVSPSVIALSTPLSPPHAPSHEPPPPARHLAPLHSPTPAHAAADASPSPRGPPHGASPLAPLAQQGAGGDSKSSPSRHVQRVFVSLIVVFAASLLLLSQLPFIISVLSPFLSPFDISVEEAEQVEQAGAAQVGGVWSQLREHRGSLALLFLTRGPIPLAPLWEKFLRPPVHTLPPPPPQTSLFTSSPPPLPLSPLHRPASRPPPSPLLPAPPPPRIPPQGHEGRYAIYVHASNTSFSFPPGSSPLFRGRLVPGGEVRWGEMSMVDAERRLLEAAVQDEANSFFALLSGERAPHFSPAPFAACHFSPALFAACHFSPAPFAACHFPPSPFPCGGHHLHPSVALFSMPSLIPFPPCSSRVPIPPTRLIPGWAGNSCIPLWPFDYVYSYIASSSASFVDAYADPYSTSFGRYIPHIFMPVIRRHQFLKGNQWFILQRRHAEAVVGDTLHYAKHNLSCAVSPPPFSLPPFVSACYSLLRSAAILDHAGRDNLSLTCIFCRCPFRLQWGKLCCADEHYIQTFLHMTDPRGISRYPTTFTDWSANDWHPSLYLGANMTDQVITTIKVPSLSACRLSRTRLLCSLLLTCPPPLAACSKCYVSLAICCVIDPSPWNSNALNVPSPWNSNALNVPSPLATALRPPLSRHACGRRQGSSSHNQPLCTAASSGESSATHPHTACSSLRASPSPRPHAVGNGHCVLGGEPRNCFLFARKFHPSTLPFLMRKSQQLLGF